MESIRPPSPMPTAGRRAGGQAVRTAATRPIPNSFFRLDESPFARFDTGSGVAPGPVRIAAAKKGTA